VIREAFKRSVTPTWFEAIGRSVMGFPSNVEMIRPKDGAAHALQETCLTKGPDPMIGSA
jgi:hypothetical protein